MKKVHLIISVFSLFSMSNAISSTYCNSVSEWAEGAGSVYELGKTKAWADETVKDLFSVSQSNGMYQGMTKKEAYQIVDMIYDKKYDRQKARSTVFLVCKNQESKGLRLFDYVEDTSVTMRYCDSVAKWSGEVGKANDEGRSKAYSLGVVKDGFGLALTSGQYPGMRMDDAYAIVDLIYMHDMTESTASERIKVICDYTVSQGLRLTSKTR